MPVPQRVRALIPWRRIRTCLNSVIALCVCLSVGPLYAIDPIPIKITGTVIATAACNFGSDETVAVEFGDVYINQISGDFYKKPVPYTLTCQGDSAGKTISMQWVANAAAFDSQLTTTDVSGLGIKLLQNNSQVSPNAWFTIDANSPPSLDVVLVKQSGASFSSGQEFNASATLKVAYQ